MDFTLKKYSEILKVSLDCKYGIFGVQKWLEQNPPRGILIRHDVDRKPVNSLKMAELEHQFGVKTTYYFRSYPCSFDPAIIQQIHSLGHEVGYHYEDLAAHKGDFQAAKKSFIDNLEKVRQYAPVTTVAMHGRPLSKINSLDFWSEFLLQDFQLKAEAFLSVDYEDVFYFTDTGRTFAETSANLRDKVSSLASPGVSSSADLIHFFKHQNPDKVALVVHPERWSIGAFDWGSQMLKDMGINTVKKGLALVR